MNEEIYEKIHILITLFAASIITAVCLITRKPFNYSCIAVIITIIAAFIFGVIAKATLNKIFNFEDTMNDMYITQNKQDKIPEVSDDDNDEA